MKEQAPFLLDRVHQIRARACSPYRSRLPAVVVIGELTLDVVVNIPIVPDSIYRYGDTVGRINAFPGGSGANIATWMARLGAQTTFCGATGRDLVGLVLEDGLRQEGITMRLIKKPEVATDIIIALVDSQGLPTYISGPRANEALEPNDLPEVALFGSDLLHFNGYSLLSRGPRQLVVKAISLMKRQQGLVSFDVSSTQSIAAIGATQLLELISCIDILFANKAEAALFAACIARQEVLSVPTEIDQILGFLKVPAGMHQAWQGGCCLRL